MYNVALVVYSLLHTMRMRRSAKKPMKPKNKSRFLAMVCGVCVWRVACVACVAARGMGDGEFARSSRDRYGADVSKLVMPWCIYWSTVNGLVSWVGLGWTAIRR